jgi:tRNA pseudouridine55 synthase
MVSALHHQGKRLYELAREGITVEREAREVEIALLELIRFTPGTHPVATLEVTCSAGTYIRALAADLGAALGTGGMMQSLRRTWVGADERTAFTLERAATLDDLQRRAEAGTLSEVVLPPVAALRSWRQFPLDAAQERRIRMGQALSLEELPDAMEPVEPGTLVALLDNAGEVCAIAERRSDRLQPVKVLNAS